MKKFAVVLAGCGADDGAEIHEATLTMLAIVRQGGEYQCFAPDVNQHHVINHITGEEMNETRNVLVESARIARGNIKDLKEFDGNNFDAIIFPGGFGVAKNLSNIAFEGANANVNAEVEKAIKQMFDLKKPIGALCISPAIIAKVLGDINVTIGQDKSTIDVIEAFGANHYETDHGDVVLDEDNLVFTTPCYMLDASITDIDDGVTNIVYAMLEMME
jgi:enhancing lycopene biosynthesis protein 2